MKTLFLSLAISVFFAGCTKETDVDTTPPSPPQGIRTVSLDNAVQLTWLPSQAPDVKGYNVWASGTYDGAYHLLGSTSSNLFEDDGAMNGVTYFYAVSAFDFDDNESDLSKGVVYDTPRPEGYDVVLTDYNAVPGVSGYDFSQYAVLPYDDSHTDVFFENAQGLYYLSVWNELDIQDMGYTSTLDDISAAPDQGWAPSKSAEAIAGHTYVLWTADNHFAKVRITEVGPNRVVYDWAYQTAAGNIELKSGHIAADHKLKNRPGKNI